jgi:hypothetical protein
MADYPANYPCPTWEFNQQFNGHYERTPYECGWTRQRRKHHSIHTGIGLSFTMSTAELATWTDWVDQNAYNTWFDIQLDDYGFGKETTTIRFTSGITYNYQTFDVVNVSVSAEVKQ